MMMTVSGVPALISRSDVMLANYYRSINIPFYTESFFLDTRTLPDRIVVDDYRLLRVLLIGHGLGKTSVVLKHEDLFA